MGTPLLERDPQLRLAQELLRHAADGRGGVIAFEGDAGIGKSALLAAVTAGTEDDGVVAAEARPTELEQTFAFGVVRRLFARFGGPEHPPELTSAGGPAAATARVLRDAHADSAITATGEAALHGLLWTLAEVAAHAPVLLAIDDAQWADEASMAWVRYAASRIGELPVAVVVATRPLAVQRTGQLARLLASTDVVTVVEIPPLSADAVERMIAGSLDPTTAARRRDVAARATGGNPFLVTELVRAWADSPEAETPPTTIRLRRAVHQRVADLGGASLRLAEAVAILGGTDVNLVHARMLAGLQLADAEACADTLRGAGSFRAALPLTFAHPLIGEALHDAIEASRAAALHRAAAELLDRAGHADEAVVAHLIVCSRTGDPWTVTRLRAAAARAAQRGADREAVTLLRRAVAEPPGDADAVDVLHELGQAEALAGDAAAETDLRRALGRARGPAGARVALTLARLLARSGRGREAAALLTEARAASGPADSELSLRVEAELSSVIRVEPGLQPAPRPRMTDPRSDLRGTTPAERLLLASLAFEAGTTGAHTDITISFAERALHDDLLIAEEGSEALIVYFAIAGLGYQDRYAAALRHFDAAVEQARQTGSVVGYALARAWRSDVLLRAGRIAEAEADAEEALSLGADHGVTVVAPLALMTLVSLWVEADRLDRAESELAAHGFDGPLPVANVLAGVQHARGRLRLALGDPEAAAADFLAAGEMLLSTGVTTPAVVPWRSDAALALAAAGQRERATTLAEEELALARALGAPRALGLALRGRALVSRPPSVGALRDAVVRLRTAGSPIELARALVDVGVLHIRAGEQPAGRDALREALDIAEATGAKRIADRAYSELLVAGALPRRRRITGRDALTPGELRVARLAAAGRSNRQIAAELFLTTKTIETHLGHVYAKLSIAGRGDLAAALAAETASLA